jgi:insulysin
MINKFQHFDIDKAINDNRNMSGIILKNGIKIIFISDNDINKSVCSVGVGAGYLHDEYEGTAHFLEHLLFMGSEKYPEQNEYTSYIQTCGGSFNAFTADYMTLYYLELDTSFFKKGVEMLSWFFKKPLYKCVM